MKVSTAREMKSIDERAIRGMGIPGLDLMEQAGRAVARVTWDLLDGAPAAKVLVFCGGGNNGGDGFVAARLLKGKGADARVVLLTEPGKLTEDASVNRRRALDAGVPIQTAQDSGSIAALESDIAEADVVIDAILGTGITGEVRGRFRDAIDAINEHARSVVAVDAPSGLDADTGRVLGTVVDADISVTFGLPKRGHFLMPGRESVGSLAVADIGFPSAAVDEEGIRVETFDEIEGRDLLPERAPDAHKWSCGHVVLIAGSTGMTGAAALASEAALRAGAGLTTLCCPKSLNAILEIKLTETMTRPMPETEAGSFSAQAETFIREAIARAAAVVVGPGISRVPETSDLVRALVPDIDRPFVLDADGLNAFAGGKTFRHSPEVVPVLTPHLGELCRIVSAEPDDITKDRIEAVRRYAGDLGVVLLLKGSPTLVADPGGEVSIILTGSNALATAGSGDVLTGVIGGLLAQGLDPYSAARLGAHLHGAAGDLAAEALGFRSVVAGDVLELLPQAIMDLEDVEETDDTLRWLM
jgi:hydroxyethylthiazole kinase-like uncharacterized protein yjeF